METKPSFLMKVFAATLFCQLAALTGAQCGLASASDAGCSQGRAEIAQAEEQLRQWENYVASEGPGVTRDQIEQLRERLRQGKAEYAARCSGQRSATAPGNTPSPAGPQPAEENPWEDGTSDTVSSDNPWADLGEEDKPTVSGPRAMPNQGSRGKGDKGSTAASRGKGASSEPDGSGGGEPEKNSAAKDPSSDYSGQSCMFFTKPPDDAHLNAYADDSWVCYGGRAYECQGRRWIGRGKCSDWKGVRDAAIIEGSGSSSPSN